MKKKIIIEPVSRKYSFSKIPSFRNLNHCSEMQKDGLVHREGLKG